MGGESTKPPSGYTGAVPTSLQEELDRVIPTVKALSAVLEIPISVDTYKAEVAHQAIKAGASMVNDVWAFEGDPEMSHVVSETMFVGTIHEMAETIYRRAQIAVAQN